MEVRCSCLDSNNIINYNEKGLEVKSTKILQIKVVNSKVFPTLCICGLLLKREKNWSDVEPLPLSKS